MRRVKTQTTPCTPSLARGVAELESRPDLLVGPSRLLTRKQRHEISDLVFEVKFKHGTNVSTLVVDRRVRQAGLFSVLPLHEEILEIGVRL